MCNAKFAIGIATVLTSVCTTSLAAPAAKITATQARIAATKKIPGVAISTKYEYEDGRWQYAVVVKRGKGFYEVEVSSTTGRVLDTERTTMAEERNEAAADSKAARAHK